MDNIVDRVALINSFEPTRNPVNMKHGCVFDKDARTQRLNLARETRFLQQPIRMSAVCLNGSRPWHIGNLVSTQTNSTTLWGIWLLAGY